MVHNTQSIHEAIDLFEAAKAQIQREGTPQHAQVLLLDFAKAYDSLDGRFMINLLYDEVERNSQLTGINLHAQDNDWAGAMKLQVAVYADDTAIYLADSAMRTEAIEAVAAFSVVSELWLNVDKSKAIRLGGEQVESTHNDSAAQNNVVEEVESTRYLGHIAGMGDTCSLVWNTALEATRVRLALAEVKTNSVHPRATIAAAVIIPKL
ncbi:reverse transcriptase, partial [Phytophthora megakarya]